MEKLKKLMSAGLAVGLFALALMVPGKAYAAEALNKFPQSNVGVHDKLDFYGLKVKVITASASAKALVSGSGFLDAICAFGGTLGKYSLAYDTYTNPPDSVVGQDVFSSVISPKVYTTNDSTSAQHGQMGCWIPPAPVKFITGLYGRQSDSAHSTLYYVHCSDGSNPCVP